MAQRQRFQVIMHETIDELKVHLINSLQQEIDALLATKYATKLSDTTWQGAALWTAIEEQMKNRKTANRKTEEALPPLN